MSASSVAERSHDAEAVSEAKKIEVLTDLGKGPASCSSPSSVGSTNEGPLGEETSDSEHSGEDTSSRVQPIAAVAEHPSIGSALHAEDACKRCCFFPKGRCGNGAACEFCHYDHDKRKRTKRKHKKAADNASIVESGDEHESDASPTCGNTAVAATTDIGLPPGLEAILNARAATAETTITSDSSTLIHMQAPEVTPPEHAFAETSCGKFRIGDHVCLNAQGCLAPEGYSWGGDALRPGSVGEVVRGGNYPHIRGDNGKIDQYWEDDLKRYQADQGSVLSRTKRGKKTASMQAHSRSPEDAASDPPGLALENLSPMWLRADAMASTTPTALQNIDRGASLSARPNWSTTTPLQSYCDADKTLFAAEAIADSDYQAMIHEVDQYWCSYVHDNTLGAALSADNGLGLQMGLDLTMALSTAAPWDSWNCTHEAFDECYGVCPWTTSMAR